MAKGIYKTYFFSKSSNEIKIEVKINEPYDKVSLTRIRFNGSEEDKTGNFTYKLDKAILDGKYVNMVTTAADINPTDDDKVSITYTIYEDGKKKFNDSVIDFPVNKVVFFDSEIHFIGL